MALTIQQIRRATSDDELFKLLSGELQVLFPPDIRNDPVVFQSRLNSAPLGLQAMAAIYDLDVSMALDDLAWHFVNHHHSLESAEETISGLHELEAPEAGEIFSEALAIIKPHWENLENAAQSENAHDWLEATGIQSAMNPLNERLWNLLKEYADNSLLSLWVRYARKHPERCVSCEE